MLLYTLSGKNPNAGMVSCPSFQVLLYVFCNNRSVQSNRDHGLCSFVTKALKYRQELTARLNAGIGETGKLLTKEEETKYRSFSQIIKVSA